MKKLFTSLILLMIGAVTTNMFADSYPLKVAGITVNDNNKDNITGSSISGSGKITYNPTQKILALSNVTITTEGIADGIYNQGIDGLRIELEGTVTITANSSGDNVAGIYCGSSNYSNLTTTIIRKTGVARTPVLKVSNIGNGAAIRSSFSSTIEFYDVNVTATASNFHAIYAATDAKLQAYVSTIKATASNSSYRAISGFKKGFSYTFAGCPLEVFDNKNHSFDTSTGSVVANGTPVSTTTLYPPIMIGAEPLSYTIPTLSTASTGATSISGKATFNCSESNPTLTLNNFSMEGNSISVRLPNLKIEVVGTNSITCSSNVLYVYANTTINGAGTLKLNSTSYAAITTYKSSTVSLSIASLEAIGKTYGYYGESQGKLWIKKYSDGTQNKFSGEKYDMYTGDLEFENADIKTANTYWKKSDGYIYYNDAPSTGGTYFASTDQIPYYDVWVGGAHVRQNCTKYIYGRYLDSGTVTYDNSTKTLTLNNVTIQHNNDLPKPYYYGIYNEINGLTINAKGTNTINVGNGGLVYTANTTVTGDVLNITSKYQAAIIADKENGANFTLALESTTPSVFQGKTWGYCGAGSSSTLTIKKGASGKGALYKFAGEWDHNLYNSKLNLGTGVKIHSKYTWFNEDNLMMYVKDQRARAADPQYGTWIRGDVEWIEYPIYICGEQLYGAKIDGVWKGNIAGFYNKYTKYHNDESIISFDPVITTGFPSGPWLTLRDVTIDYNPDTYNNIGVIQTDKIEQPDLWSTKYLCINFLGTCNLYATNAYTALWIRNSQVLLERRYASDYDGDRTLNLKSKFCDIYPMQGSSLYLRTNVLINATDKGIWSNNGKNEINIFAGELRAKKIYDIDELLIQTGHAITEPKGATFYDRAVRTSTGSIAENVVIKKLRTGDVNNDGKVDISDAVSVLEAMAGYPVPGDANVNGDRVIDIADFVAVLDIMAGQ